MSFRRIPMKHWSYCKRPLKKQFVKLIQGELMDMETDIEALKNTINWEG